MPKCTSNYLEICMLNIIVIVNLLAQWGKIQNESKIKKDYLSDSSPIKSLEDYETLLDNNVSRADIHWTSIMNISLQSFC